MEAVGTTYDLYKRIIEYYIGFDIVASLMVNK
jgi:hypothetical protein